jgi:hypothetical protein
MQEASAAYKSIMRQKYRNQLSYMRVTIGLINQEAQASAYVPEPENYAYYSNLKRPLDNYMPDALYVTCDQDYTTTDGTMYFLPRKKEDVILNQGIVSKGLLGPIEIRFPLPYDIKGLTIEFGKAFPVNFRIESDNNTVDIAGNAAGHYVTEEIFTAATYLRFVPMKMVNGQSRFRILQITMGIGIYFDSRKILSATKKEHISPISEELPTIDLDVTVRNKDRAYDVENKESTINFLEIGQTVEALYGREMDDGTVEWIPGTMLSLKDWSADDEKMTFSASDCFDWMDGTYYRGIYRPEGISLYDLAADVFQDAGVDERAYWIDPYLMSVKVNNPMPAVAHKEALQIIANAGRCIIYQNRTGKIYFRSNFIPDMTASAEDETQYSKVENIITPGKKDEYVTYAADFIKADGTQFFLPEQKPWLNTGYVSQEISEEDGNFKNHPRVTLQLEAAFTCFGILMQFGGNPPTEFILHSYLYGVAIENITIDDISQETIISREFKTFDRLEIEFISAYPHNRILLDYVGFGDVTDYHLDYGYELTSTPKGIQLEKVRELQIVRTLYNQNDEVQELINESISVTQEDNCYTFYFTNPSYDFSCALIEPQDGQTATIINCSCYSATVEITGVNGACTVSITGREYIITKAHVSRRLNPTGSLEVWENPLVSDVGHAGDLAEWIGNYLQADREYELKYRGEPRLDANDLAYLENKYVPDLLVRVFDHTLKYNGGLSGTIKARRYMDVDTTS